jgi:hypothetical protein
MHQKKVISKNVTENALFALLLMFVKLVLRITFFWCISNFEAKRAKNGSKNQKTYCVLDLNFAHIKKSVFLIFSKKVKFVVP